MPGEEITSPAAGLSSSTGHTIHTTTVVANAASDITGNLHTTEMLRGLISEKIQVRVAVNLLDAVDKYNNHDIINLIRILENLCQKYPLNNNQFGALCTYIVDECGLRASGGDSEDIDLEKFDYRNTALREHSLESKIQQILGTYGI